MRKPKRIMRYKQNRFHTSANKTREANPRGLSFDDAGFSSSRALALLKSRAPVKQSSKPFKLNVYTPPAPLDKELICSERRERKEVLFAIGRAGKGGANNRAPFWNEKSFVRCR